VLGRWAAASQRGACFALPPPLALRSPDVGTRLQSHDYTVKLWEIGYLREDAGAEGAPDEDAAAASDDDSDDSDSDEKDARKGKGTKRKPEEKQGKASMSGGKKGKPGKGGARDPHFFAGLV